MTVSYYSRFEIPAANSRKFQLALEKLDSFLDRHTPDSILEELTDPDTGNPVVMVTVNGHDVHAGFADEYSALVEKLGDAATNAFVMEYDNNGADDFSVFGPTEKAIHNARRSYVIQVSIAFFDRTFPKVTADRLRHLLEKELGGEDA